MDAEMLAPITIWKNTKNLLILMQYLNEILLSAKLGDSI